MRQKRLWEFFVSDCELLVTKSQWYGYHRNINTKKHQIQDLTFDNASLSDFAGFFALKTNQKITCVDFRGEITTRNRERYHLISWHLTPAFKTTTIF